MAPTAASVDGDLKELREDLHKVEVTLINEIHKVDNGLTELRTDVKNAVGIGKWVASIVVGLLLTGGVSAVWWASAMTKDVGDLKATLAKILEQTKPK
jgi:hypothetical protein